METGKIKLALSAGVLALSMALAGCGGGGSSTAGAGGPPQPTAEMTAATNAINAALAAVNALTSESDDEAVMAAQILINTASTRVDALPDDEEASYDARIAVIQSSHDDAEQRVDVATAIQAASDAVDTLTITSEQPEIDRVQGLINTARTEIDDLPDAEEADQDTELDSIQTRHDTAEAGAVAERNRVIAEGNQQTTEAQRQILAEVSRLFEVVTSEGRKAADAQKAAEKARTDSRKYNGELSATKVKGESETAKTNAQNVLDAVGKVDQEVANAKAALDALNQAETDAEALDDSVAQKAELIASIDAAIETAEDNYEAAKALADARGANSVFLLAQHIRGGIDGDDTPADKGREVAAEISTALAGVPSNRPNGTVIAGTASLRPSGYSGAATRVAKSNDDEPSSLIQLSHIVNADLVAQPIGNTPTMTAVLAGETASDVQVDGSTIAASNYDNDGIEGTTTYKGISGTVYCLVTRCTISNGKLGAGWYFSPEDNFRRYYEPHPTRENQYRAYSNYAEYGYWLSAASATSTDPINDIHTFANSYAARSTGDSLTNPNIDNDLGEATYMGKALGISVVTGRHEDNPAAALESGEFTATVELKAEFDATPVVSGEIHSFVGEATRSNWRVRLLDRDLSTSGTSVAQTGGTNTGTWTANPYGGDNTAGQLARPGGIIGDFAVDFVDGRAVGAYATRKQ